MHSNTILQKRPEWNFKKNADAFCYQLYHKNNYRYAPDSKSSREENLFRRFLQNKNTIIFYHTYLIGENTMECRKCGACCRLIVLQHSNPTKKSLEYYRVRGWTFDPVNDLVWIPSVCPHLLDNNTCTIYKSRPKQCRLYPTRTPGSVVPPGCAFEK